MNKFIFLKLRYSFKYFDIQYNIIPTIIKYKIINLYSVGSKNHNVPTYEKSYVVSNMTFLLPTIK